jgi:hypothetical protein
MTGRPGLTSRLGRSDEAGFGGGEWFDGWGGKVPASGLVTRLLWSGITPRERGRVVKERRSLLAVRTALDQLSGGLREPSVNQR